MASPTTAQSLGALLKSARDLMRKNNALNGDLDRLPVLTSSGLRPPSPQRGEGGYKPAIEPPHRWRDWAAKSDGITIAT